ncbi:MAG: hypothetical protein U1E45_04180 [Geminicoccaceae bacterium]
MRALVAALLALLPVPALAAGLLLQQAVPANGAGTAYLMLERDRLITVRARKEKSGAYAIEITLAADPPIVQTIRCTDPAATRQIIDALRVGGEAVLDVTGRCEL